MTFLGRRRRRLGVDSTDVPYLLSRPVAWPLFSREIGPGRSLNRENPGYL